MKNVMEQRKDYKEIYNPTDCVFSCELDDYYQDAIAVFIDLKDTNTPGYCGYLGSHNLIGLPEYFGSEAAESYWVIEETSDLDKIKSHMIMCGFTYEEKSW